MPCRRSRRARAALKTLLQTKQLDANLVTQLVVQSLNPLQVSLEIARLRLQESSDEQTWQVCHLVGLNALIAGYAFLNQDVSHLQEELQQVIGVAQKKMLDVAAFGMLAKGMQESEAPKAPFPWERVSWLLSPEGAEDLLQFYLPVAEELEQQQQVSSGPSFYAQWFGSS